MTLSGFFIMMWKDERLAWQHDDFASLHVSIFELTLYKIHFYVHITIADRKYYKNHTFFILDTT